MENISFKSQTFFYLSREKRYQSVFDDLILGHSEEMHPKVVWFLTDVMTPDDRSTKL